MCSSVEVELMTRSDPVLSLGPDRRWKESPRQGAVRVAAIEKKRFEVTDFVSEEAILKDFDQLYAVFPAAVCETIEGKMRR